MIHPFDRKLVLILNLLTSSMAPPSKINAEQKAYLTNLMDQFLEAQKRGRLDKFWQVLYKGWFEKWPDNEDMKIVDEDERKKELGERLLKRQNVCSHLFGQ